MTYLLLREYNILPKKELHSSLWVDAKHGLRHEQLHAHVATSELEFGALLGRDTGPDSTEGDQINSNPSARIPEVAKPLRPYK